MAPVIPIVTELAASISYALGLSKRFTYIEDIQVCARVLIPKNATVPTVDPKLLKETAGRRSFPEKKFFTAFEVIKEATPSPKSSSFEAG